MPKVFELEKFNGKAAVVTGFFTAPLQVVEATNDLDLCIILGSLIPNEVDKNIKEIIMANINIANKLSEKYVYLLNYKDLMFVDFTGFAPEYFTTNEWLMKQCLSATITFSNFSRFVFTCGAILPQIKEWQKDKNNFLLAHERPDINWAAEYDGRFGFAVSSSSSSQDIEYNQHSCIIGNRDKPITLNVNHQGIDYI